MLVVGALVGACVRRREEFAAADMRLRAPWLLAEGGRHAYEVENRMHLRVHRYRLVMVA
jgi:hypothetical protein